MSVRQLTLSLTTLAIIAALTACASQPRESIELGQESFDGLRVVKDTTMHRVWVREGLDLSGYDQLILRGAGIEYRPVRAVRTTAARRTSGEFPVTPQQQERLRNIARESFTQELGNSERFTLTETPGPNVLLVEAALIDVVSFVPPEPVGRGDIFVSRIAEATLVIEVSDSESGGTLARVVDRRAAEPAGGRGQRSNTVLNQAEVRRLMNRWASQLRIGLDTLHDHIPR